MKLSAALLLALLLLNSFFYCLYYNMCRWQREGAVKAEIAGSDYKRQAILLKIPAAAAPAPMFNDDEITWNGMLFDVVKRQVIHDTIYVYGIPDAEEQAMVDKINDYITGDLNQELKCGHTIHPVIHLIKLLPQLYLNAGNTPCYLNFAAAGLGYYTGNCRCCTYPDIPAPPPKLYSPHTVHCIYSRA